MYDVAKTYRLDPFDTFWEEDLGASLNATVIPMLKKSTTGTYPTTPLLFLLLCPILFIHFCATPPFFPFSLHLYCFINSLASRCQETHKLIALFYRI